MIKEAIILAGGRGTRIAQVHKDMPKGFLRLNDGLPIVELSVRKLLQAGMEHIVIGTGHLHEYYDELAARYPGVETIRNSNYAETGSMSTLQVAFQRVSGDILLLESDLIYDKIGLFVLLQDFREDVILASGRTSSGDEVFLEENDRHELVALGKNAETLSRICGELVGISKLSFSTVHEMCRIAERSLNPGMEYEEAMTAVAQCRPIGIRKIENYLWREIDDPEQLAMASRIVMPQIIESEANYAVRREILLNPGPATTTDSVKFAQVIPDICPREKEFGEILLQVERELTGVVASPERYVSVLFGGSGTAADEAMIASCVDKTDSLLIVDNGAYGRRLATMAEIYGLTFEVFRSPPFLPLDMARLEEYLVARRFSHLACVFHETTTGMLNPAKAVGELCKKHGVTVLVDAVSAYAGIPFDLDDCGIDFMTATSNKNIQGIAGIAFVVCKKEKLAELKGKTKRTLYLDIYDQHEYFQRTGQTRFTPPVQAFYALRQALLELKQETVAGRYRRYSACWNTLVEGARKLGLQMPVPLEWQSRLITTFLEPTDDRFDFSEMHDFLRSRGFTIYPGKLTDLPTFRVANIGDVAPDEMNRFVDSLEEYFISHEIEREVT